MSRIAILLPDGVGLRNFIYSDFISKLEAAGNEVYVWNGTVFPVNELGYREIPLCGKINPKTDIIKNVRKKYELRRSYRLTENPIYLDYEFKVPLFKSLRGFIKKVLSLPYSINGFNRANNGWFAKQMDDSERKTAYYQMCKKKLMDYGIDKVFCTNQRHIKTVAPIVAAKDLGLPTSTFIFSWDNLPKGTMVVNTDKYYVWSDYMKKELIFYYPYIKEDDIIIVGTPQFMPHFDENMIIGREEFFESLSLEANKKYLCFSGDDVTTSPYDQLYLRDIAEQVKLYNSLHNENYAILFRRCPVDFSGRYDEIVKEYSDVIFLAEPLWENRGTGWNCAMPTLEDQKLLVNTIHHSILTINVGSSIVFDAVCHQSPTCYIDYNPIGCGPGWTINKVYKYIHFRSMPSDKVVYWLKSDHDLAFILDSLDNTSAKVVNEAQRWFKVICDYPIDSIDQFVNSLTL